MNMKCPFPSLLINFGFSTILVDITQACFLGPFDLKIFSALYSKVMSILMLRCVPYMHQNNGCCFLFLSFSPCLLVYGLGLWILRDMTNDCLFLLFYCCWWQCVYVCVSLSLCVCVCFPFCGFAYVGLCLDFCFVGVLNILELEVFLLVFCVGQDWWINIV